MVARRAHNPKVVGSNPAPATTEKINRLERLFFCLEKISIFYCHWFGVCVGSCRLCAI